MWGVQVGQCGNQIGCRFWDMALREHAAHNPKGRYDERRCTPNGVPYALLYALVTDQRPV